MIQRKALTEKNQLFVLVQSPSKGEVFKEISFGVLVDIVGNGGGRFRGGIGVLIEVLATRGVNEVPCPTGRA